MAFGNKEIRSDGAIKNRISIFLNFPVAFTEMLLTLASFDLFWLLCLQHYRDLYDLHFMTERFLCSSSQGFKCRASLIFSGFLLATGNVASITSFFISQFKHTIYTHHFIFAFFYNIVFVISPRLKNQ